MVAGYAIETPRLLLNSADRRHPDGLGNSSGLVVRSVHSEIDALLGFLQSNSVMEKARSGAQKRKQSAGPVQEEGSRAYEWVAISLLIADRALRLPETTGALSSGCRRQELWPEVGDGMTG